MIHTISTGRITLERLKEIIDNHATLVLSEEAKMAILKCRRYLDEKMKDPEKPMYGITTGFGSLYNVTIPKDDLSQLQHNLVMSHACGAGETVRPEIVKLMLFLKAQSLSYGHSGAQLITVQRLIDMKVDTKEAFSLVMTHECAHRVLQNTHFYGPNNGAWEQELCFRFRYHNSIFLHRR